MKTFRKGSIGIVIDVIGFSLFERKIESQTGDGFHVYAMHGCNKITEALVKEGVVENKFDKYWDGKSVSMILEPKKEFFSDKVLAKVCKEWDKDIGKKYDIKNIFWTQLFKSSKYRSDRKRICSEHVAAGYNVIGYQFLGKHYSIVSPNDILRDSLYKTLKEFNTYIIHNSMQERCLAN